MSDEEINGKITLGYTWPKGRLNKKRDFRRINNYEDSKYKEDPVKGIRLAINLSDKVSQDPNDSQNKKSKSKKTSNQDVFSLGCQKTFNPESEYKAKLIYTYKLSDKEKIDEWIEELKSNKEYQIKTETYLADFISEDLCVQKLNKLFEMEVEQDKTAITVNNPWIQIVLGILIMTKDFINYNDNFSLEGKKKKDKIPLLFDIYWNFQNKENISSVNSNNCEFKKLLFETKHESEVKRVQSYWMNLCFRGLAYYYSKNGVDYSIDRVMIHFEGNETDKARAIAEIEDMSHLMIELAQFEIEEYDQKALKKKNDGTLLILDRITFADPSFNFIPAMLPMYIVNIKEGESDESDGSDKSNESDWEENSDNEEKDESEDFDYKKNIKSKKGKKNNKMNHSESEEKSTATSTTLTTLKNRFQIKQ